MNPPPPDLPQVIVVNLVLLTIVGCLAVWVTIITRWLRRLPVLPYEPRRRVPWKTVDIVLIASIYVFSQVVVFQVAYKWFGIPPKTLAPAAKVVPATPDDPISRAHPLTRALSESPDPWTILLCVASAVFIAPMTEELVFRLVLQGWLESVERRMRRRTRFLRQFLTGILPITAVSILFAAMHGRSGESRMELPLVVFLLSVYSMASLLTVVLSVCWLRFAAGATLVDFGIVPSKLTRDLRTGGLAFFAVAMPVLIFNVILNALLPKNIVADPIPIFFLAIVFGILYYRTHRIVPSLALHMAFNAVGVLAAIMQAK
jgi:membrane protease YdiL (CAAX protease family)